MLSHQFILSAFVSLIYCSGYCQEKELLLLPKGMSVTNVSWSDSIYTFRSFQPGKVTFSTKFTPAGDILVNYNEYLMRMEIINDKSDTLEILPSEPLNEITIHDRHFKVGQVLLRDFNFVTFVEVSPQSPAALGVLNYIKDEKREYWPYRRVADVRGHPTTLDRYYSKARAYFFFVENKFYPATKPKLLSISGRQKKDIAAYIDQHQIDFNNEQDLISVLNFYNSLKTGN